jgi:predicted nucleic acid-binding protein
VGVTRYLLDTNTLTAAARHDPRVLRRVEQHEGDLGVSAISVHEMEWGYLQLAEGKTRTMVEKFLRTLQRELEIVPYDAAAARWHARHRAGRRILLDEMIAASAATRGLVLVTRNVRDFRRFELDVETW